MSSVSFRSLEMESPLVIDRALRLRIAKRLHGNFKGAFIDPEHAEYEAARCVWNGMVDKRPGLILRCTCTADVVAAIQVARELELPPSIRGGGHSVSGKALSDGGLTIDLSGMRKVTVDPKHKLVHVDGGCLLGDVDAATAEHGLIVPAGIMSETGVGGLALGGGIGWFARKYGLTCDHFLALELVLANGEVIEVSALEHAELFWALKGGGGNFGIVTRFTFKAHAFGPMMRVGVSLYDPEDTTAALREYARIVPELPRTVGWHAALKAAMPPLPFVPPELVGKRMLMLLAMWLDGADAPEGNATLERLTQTGKPRLIAINTVPFAAVVQKTIDEEYSSGHRYYTKEAHIRELAPSAIDTLVDFWKDMPMQGEIEIICLGGAISDIDEEATAFSHRQYLMWFNFAMRWDDPLMDGAYIERTRRIVDDLRPWIGDGVYSNMLNFDEKHRAIEALGGQGKYTKLASIKARYDPSNLFQMNCNIVPNPH